MKQKIEQILESVYDFRQFIIFLILLAVAVVFRSVNFIDGGQFVDLMKNVTIALFAVHGVQHLIIMGKAFISAKYKQLTTAATGSSSDSSNESDDSNG